MFVTNWISTTKIQKISEITNFFRHYFLSRTEVVIEHSNEVNKRCTSVYQLMWLNWVKDMAELGYTDGWTH